ncbi:MAG: hypothetical protein QF918_05965, partial [Pirellulaceae bacterium]|nr:hypothetical protein [Pirellulaceae bacterium]
MRYTMTSLLMLALVVSVTTISTAAEARMTPELLWELGRVSGGAVSGDGLQIAYTVRSYELKENTGSSELHLLTLDGRRDRVIGKAWKSVSDLQWGQGTSAGRLFFVGIPTDVEDAKPQVWSVNPKKVKPRQVTDIEAGVANLKVAPTGTHLA